MSKSWPPPPDIESVRELVATADIEGLISGGAPTDEYDPEAELLFKALQGSATEKLTSDRILPVAEDIWRKSFSLDNASIQQRGDALANLVGQVARFFGPAAKPRLRAAASDETEVEAS